MTDNDDDDDASPGEVLLFYKYVVISDPSEIKEWQKRLCESLNITGKIRISTEGINVTVGGSKSATEQYKKELLSHPLFSDIKIKTSPGGAHAFDNLRVSLVQEAIPLNLPLNVAPAKEAADHLTPEEAHHLLSNPPDDLVILDARNYYESRIGHFKGAVMPNIRKFSHFPEYLQKNLELLTGKTVFMYCTGGIRCERGSAYLRSLNISSKIYQLEGGIHEYVRQYPDGHFRGKNYVFDKRVALPANTDIISTCNYCDTPFDTYGACCRPNCCIVSLCCDECKEKRNGIYYCCNTCQTIVDDGLTPYPCDCTTVRLNYKDVEEYYKTKKQTNK